MKTRLFLIIAFVFMTGSLSAQDNKASSSLTAAIYEEEVKKLGDAYRSLIGCCAGLNYGYNSWVNAKHRLKLSEQNGSVPLICPLRTPYHF